MAGAYQDQESSKDDGYLTTVPSLTVPTFCQRYNVPLKFAVLSIDAEGVGDKVRKSLLILKKKLKIALYYTQREIHTVAGRAAPGDLGLMSHPKDY